MISEFPSELPCNYKPELVTGAIGMFHCPECGEMILAGMPHPDYGLLDTMESNDE